MSVILLFEISSTFSEDNCPISYGILVILLSCISSSVSLLDRVFIAYNTMYNYIIMCNYISIYDMYYMLVYNK